MVTEDSISKHQASAVADPGGAAVEATVRYVPGDVFDVIGTMKVREDGMDVMSMGQDGVFRIYGFHEPEFTEPYVVDYRNFDPGQIKQWFEHNTSGNNSFEPPFDISNLDGREVVNETQLLQPEEIGLLRARYQKHAKYISENYGKKPS